MATDNYGGAGGNPAFSVSNGMYDQQTVQRYIDFYKKDPKAFNSAQKETLRGYAHYYNLPFALNDEDQEFNIARALRNVGEGFIEGFTTVHIGKKPTHPVDRIARSIGSLAGFVGFIPGVPQFKGLSLPMLGAKFSTKQATKFAGKITKAGGLLKSGALKSSIDFLSKPITADILEGAFFRGSASAISSWEGGVDEMMKGFAWGATTGGIDRAIGNLITVGDPDGLARKAVKSIASSIAQGAPMTAMGAPKEEQIYEYLLGGYFGWSEPSYIDKASQKNIFDIANKMRYSNPFIEPKDLKGWKDLPDAVKARTNELYEKEFGTLDQNAILNNEMMKRIGETPEEVKVQYEEIVKKLYGDEGIPEEDKGLSVVALNQKLIDMDEKPIEGLEQLWSTEGQDKLEQSVLNWTGKNLEHLYNVGDDSTENNNRRIKLAVNIQNYWRDITAGDNKKIPQGIEMIKFLENKENNFDIPVLSEEQQAWWINKGLQKAYRENVPTASIEISDNVTDYVLADGTRISSTEPFAKLKFHPGKTILASGEDKTKREPPKFIEHVYETEKLKYAPDKKESIPRNILDVSFVTERSSQTGLIEAKKLADYSEGLKYKKDALNMDAVFDQVSEQFDKEGFYYYGGKGDNQTWTFMKYHPAIADMSIAQIKQEANALYNEGIKAGVIDRKTFVEDMKQWNTTKDKSKGYLKGLVSNARYELAMNGLDDEGYSSLFSDGNWVNSAKAFNKRSQIWFTSGYEYDSKMFDHIVSTDKDVEWNNYKEIDGKMEPVLKYVISTGAEGVYDQKLLSDKSLASMHEQGLDGAIMVLPERLDVVNRTGGMLTSGKKNKSFIISKGEKRMLQDGSEENLGTLLGKYMFHIAPPEEAADLRKKGLDMIVYTNSAKQYGRRKAYHAKYSPDTGEIDFLNTKDKNNIFKENEIEGYDLPLKDIKNVLTERTDLHNKVSDWASLPKQMLTNPSEYVYGAKSDEDIVRYRDTIKNMQEELVGRAIDGDDTINRLADEYMADPSNPKKMKELVNNLDKLSLTRLMQMFNKDGLEEFSFLAFNKISRQNKEFVEDLIASGEHTKDTYYDFMQNMLDESSAVGKHQSLDKGTGGSLTHKFNINYVNDVLNSYIANRATRPKTGNAFAFRMSPYFDSLHHRKNPEGETYQLNRDIIEKGSQLSRLYGDGHKGEDFFFFNDGHKDLEIMFLGNKRKLGDIWSEFIKKSNESGTTIEDLKPYHDLLEAIVLRVPMDSNSGAQVLKFGGFTGTEGGGSLIHPRKMELLGGADLDGDKDFVFFGGRGEAGERGEHREGFRNSWKQYFKEQADEFYEYRNTKTGETMSIDEYNSIGSIAKKTTPQQAKTEYKKVTAYHGTEQTFNTFDFKKAGITTQGSDTQNFMFFSSDKDIAGTYKDYTKNHEIKRLKLEIKQMRDGSFQRYIDSGDMTKADVSQSIRDLEGEMKKLEAIKPKGQVMKRTLSFKNPLVLDGNKLIKEFSNFGVVIDYLGSPGFLKRFKRGRHDGIVIKNFAHGIDSDKKGTMYMVSKKETISNPSDKSDWVKVQKHNKDAIDPETGKAFKDHFVETDENITDKMNNSFLRLSPNQRLQASKGAYEGRPKLGTAVNTRSFISAYYSLLRKHGGERVESGEGNILITPKTDNASLSRFSSLARAAIAVTSDPMDEAGIKDRSVFFNVMFKSLFNVKQTDGSNLSTEDMLKIASKGKYNDIKNVNNLFYGKDSFTGRGFTPLQKANKLKDIRISSDETSTFLPRLYNSLKHVKGGINPLEKLNLSGMTNTIDKINKGLDDPQMDSLRKIMKRASLSSGLSDQLKMIATEKPYLLKNYEAIVSGEKNIQKYLAKGLKYSADDLDDPRWRAWQLDKVIKQANDFITNGLTDLAFISSSPKYLDSLRKAFPGDSEKDFGNRVEGILKFADSLKSASWLRKYSEKGANEELSPKLAFMKQELKDKGLDGSNIKEGMDKYEIDDTIRKFKKTHSPEENNLLDLFLLSSYGEGTGMSSRTKKKRIKEIEESRLSNKSKRDKIIEVEKEFKKNVTTNVSRLAYSSDAVNLRVMGDFQDTYNGIYKGFTNKPPEKIVKLAQKVEAETENIVKVFNKSLNKVKPFDFIESSDVESYIGKEYLDKYIGLAKDDGKRTFFEEGKLTDEQAKISNNIDKLLTHFMPSAVGRDIRGFFRDVTNKSVNAMNMEDWRTVERFLESMKPGWIEKYIVPDILDEKGENVGLGLTSWVWKMFPTALNRQLMRKGAKLKERDNWYLTPFGKVLGKTHTPTHFIEGGQEWVHRTEQAAVGLHDKLTREFYKELSPFIGITDEDNNDVGLRIYRSAIAEREGSPQALAMLKNLYKDRGDVEDIVETYKGRSVEIFVENKWDTLKRKEFNVKTGEGKVERLTGEQIAKRINNVVTDRVKQMNELQQGKEGALDRFIVKDEKGNPETYTDGTPIFNFDKNKRSGAEPILAHIEEFINTYKDIPTDIGIYGWQLISKSHNLKRLGDQLFELKVKINEFKPLTSAESKKEYKKLTDKYTKMLKAHKLYMSIKITPPGALPFDFYFPHINSENLKMSTTEFKKSLAKTTKLPPEEQEGAVKNLLDAFHRMNGNYEDIETLKLSVGEKVIDKYLLDKVDFDEKTDTDIKWLDRITKSAHQKKREAHLGGWSVEPEVMANYFERLSSTYFKNIATIATRNNLFDFEDDIADAYGKWDEGIKQNWVNLYKLYIQKALGNPAVIPEYMLENEGMAFRGSLYAGWSDGHVAKTIDNVFTKLGLKKHLLPEEYQSLEKMTPQDVIRWSNIEAKYQVATLLAHPKASINNIYGGTTHTGISAGWRNLSKAKQFEYVRNAINPEWKGWDDVNVWLTEIGIHEDFMRSELNVNPAFKNAKWRKAGSEIIDILVKNPDAEKSTLSAVLKKHGIVDSAFNAAAWFMHRPERMIRRDAFLAHYFNALEHLGGAVSDPMTNPYLLRMAEKGVKATQFLYSNAHRPMFAAPALGKVMNRFQLFSWNSIRFRNDIRRQAKIHGYKPGSPEFSRYKRLVTTDMLSLALANAFAYSLFDTALPPPLNWLQDFADWIFGEKKERERAFYGTYPGAIAPLQLFTPPIARMIVPTINAMIDDDYSKLANYHTWTMFPFGRIAKTGFDTFKNPIMLPDKATGIPFMGMSKYNKQLQSYNVRARGILNTISEKKNKE